MADAAKKEKPMGEVVIGLGLGGKKPKGGMMDDDSDEEKSAHDEAAQALIDAVKDGDVAGVKDAFHTMYDLCHSGGYDEGDSAGEE